MCAICGVDIEVDIFAADEKGGGEDTPGPVKPWPDELLPKVGSCGGSLGRRVRSLRNRLSREGRELGTIGVEGLVGDCGGALTESESKGSSSNSTFGTGEILIKNGGLGIFTRTCLLIGCIYGPPGFTPKRLEIYMCMKLIDQYLSQRLRSPLANSSHNALLNLRLPGHSDNFANQSLLQFRPCLTC